MIHKLKKGSKARYSKCPEHIFVVVGDIFFNDYFKQWQVSDIKPIGIETWGYANVPLSDIEPAE